jgi:DNA-binding CsgD family transcriptional regulator/DNA-binding transcriptional regulator GbsR (MarR family)
MNPPETATGERLLARFGISENAECVWRVLLSSPEVTLDELRRRAERSERQLSLALAELVDAGFVRDSLTPTGVVAIDPTLAVEAHMARAERQMAEMAEEFANVRFVLPQLSAGYDRSRASSREEEPCLEIVRDLPGIRRQIGLAAERVRQEIRSTEHAAFSLAVTGQWDAQFAVLDRGVRDRTIIASPLLEDPVVFEEFREMQERGHETRSLPSVCNRMMIYDNDLLIVAVDPARLDRGALFIRQRGLIDLMTQMYDNLWSLASPVFTAPAIAELPNGRSARVLELMSLGFKDQAIARAVGVGVRTIRRDISLLKNLLGVSTRAEIVAAAVRKEWL